MERAIQDVEEQIRVIKDALDDPYGHVIEAEHPSLPWLVNHAAYLLTRFQVGVDGRTAYERLRGKPFRRTMLPFGECVHWMPSGRAKALRLGQKLNKLESKWRDGVFLGFKESSNEYFIGTPTGVFRAQSVRRKPDSAKFV